MWTWTLVIVDVLLMTCLVSEVRSAALSSGRDVWLEDFERRARQVTVTVDSKVRSYYTPL